MSHSSNDEQNSYVPSEEVVDEGQAQQQLTVHQHVDQGVVHFDQRQHLRSFQADQRQYHAHHHHHQHIDRVIKQVDKRQFHTTMIYNLPEQSCVPSGDEGSTKELKKLQQAARKQYHPKYDVDLSSFDVSPEGVPEIYCEMYKVDFYQGRFIPDDDKYNPKSQGIKLNKSDQAVTIDQLVYDIQTNSFVSVIGYPGSGKTTLSKRLARRLAKSENVLVLRKLFMDMNDHNTRLTLKEFLLGDCNYNLTNQEQNSVFEWMTANPENCFIIFDGLDQVSWNLKENVEESNYNTPLQYWKLVSNLCLKRFLQNCHLIFTSRPHAMLHIHQTCRPKRTYFIHDLTPENMKTLFDALVNDQQQSEMIWNNLTVKTSHLKSICHNPLMLQLYVRASLGSSQLADISTMTRIFHIVLLNLKTSGHARISISDDIVIRLSKIAYEATKKGIVLITKDDLETEHLSSQEVQDLVVTLLGANREYALLEGQQRLYFSHQTFQEYFSALYICRKMSLTDFRSFVQNNLLKGHWAVVAQFTSGLLLDPFINKDQSGSAMNQPPSVEFTSALTQPSTSSSQIASNPSSTALNKIPLLESSSALTQPLTSSSQTASNLSSSTANQQLSPHESTSTLMQSTSQTSQIASNLPQNSLQESQQLTTPPKASNRLQSSSASSSSPSASQDSKPQSLKSRFTSLRKKILPNNSTSKTTQQPLSASTSSQTPSSSHQPSSSATSSFQSSFFFQLKSKSQTLKETVRSATQKIFLRKPTELDEKMKKRQLFVKELLKETRKVAADYKDGRSIIAISKILREGNDLEVIVTAGSHFDRGRIWMRPSDTQNDCHAVTSFFKSMPTRLGELDLSGCRMNSNQFRPWKEAIKSMPRSIVRMFLYDNLLSVDDVIDVLHKIEEEVEMWRSLDDRDEGWRDPNMEERSKLQEALDRLDNKKLKIDVGDDYVTHKDG